MQKKNLIVFDIDGTLTDSVKIHQRSFVDSLYEIGVEQIDSNFKEYTHHTDSYIAKEIYEKDRKMPFSESKINEFENILSDKISSTQINEIHGALQLIQQLEETSNFGVCFATGSLLKPAKYKLKSIHIDFTPSLLVAATTQLFKRETIVQKAIANASDYYQVTSFERIISVGDGLWDLKTANNLELEFIGIGKDSKEVLLANGAKRHFDDLTKFNTESPWL